jgi:hypothetical protein
MHNVTGYPHDGYDGSDRSFAELQAAGPLAFPGVMSGLDMIDLAARRTLARREDAAAIRCPDAPAAPAVYGRAGTLASLARDLAVMAA